MFKVIQTLALVIMIVLFPPAALITVSQGAVPGEMTYPLKRSLEDVVLFLAGFNPLTKAYFAVAQANRRYDETESLLAKGADANNSLNALVSQTDIAVTDINNISNTNQKARLIADLSSSIDKYDRGLAQAQEKIERNSGQSPTPTTVPQSSTQTQELQSTRQTPTPNPTTADTNKSAPKTTQRPTPKPETPSDEEARRKQQEIEKARKELEELRKKLEEEKKKLQQANRAVQSSPTPTPQPSPSPSPTPTPSPRATVNPEAAAQPSPSAAVRSKNKSNYNPKWNKTDNDPNNDDDNGDDD